MEIKHEKIEVNSYLFEKVLDFVKVHRFKETDSFLKAIERVAKWAWFHHPGRFADGALENHALDVGLNLNIGKNYSEFNLPFRKRHVSRTLHIATTLFGVGGHSRALVKWVERDKSAEHIVLLTNQRHEVPYFLKQIITKSRNYCVYLPVNESIENRAALVRIISRSCDRVILHTHPHDSIPVVAFAKNGGPPIAMFNHAHYSFNLGSTVADLIINTHEYFRKISENYRFARSTTILAGSGLTSLWPISSGIVDKEIAKRKLSLPENSTVIMSIAQEHYFKPMEGYNFFRTANSILKRLPNAYLMIVGMKKGSQLVPDDLISNPRLLLMGYVQNPIVHYQSSDIVLESFPMPSLGGLTEAVAYGEAYPVPVYGPRENILRIQRSIAPFPYRPADEEAYVEYVVSLAKKKDKIRAEARKMREKMAEHDRSLESRISSLNKLVDNLKHNPCEIPIARMINSDDCRILAELDQSTIGEKIDSLYPFVQSIYYQFEAVLRRQHNFITAIKRIFSRLKELLSERLVQFLRKLKIIKN